MKKLSWFDKFMTAVTFAEANELDVAKNYLNGCELIPTKEQKEAGCGFVLTNDLRGAEVQS